VSKSNENVLTNGPSFDVSIAPCGIEPHHAGFEIDEVSTGALLSCGDWIRTSDLKVMSLTSYQTALLRCDPWEI
jgi:hypothetical protein